MSIYCMADIHGNYAAYQNILEQINFKDTDILYVLGDVIDRGQNSMDILFDMMCRPNVIPIIGNHEYMGLQCLRFLSGEITEESIAKLDEGIIQGVLEWQNVGGQATIDEFHRLSGEEKEEILEYLEEFSAYEEVTVAGKDYVLVHAGLGNFSPKRGLEDYALYELAFSGMNEHEQYYSDKYIVAGHVPTRNFLDNPKPDYIYRFNNCIVIDCGWGYGGQLGCICLNTGEEFYSGK